MIDTLESFNELEKDEVKESTLYPARHHDVVSQPYD